MRKRDDKKNRREIIHSLAMLLQIGLSMLICMGMSMAIGYYIDRLFKTKYWIIIMMVVGILAAMRSLLVLTGRYKPGEPEQKTGENAHGDGEEESD
ncbi:MAG: AtpZ/AtpI family protein [Lachnospiraceae bacterium]|nr:AtpZ/AtpI family protein [Lachnospiraceae bacterium]